MMCTNSLPYILGIIELINKFIQLRFSELDIE